MNIELNKVMRLNEEHVSLESIEYGGFFSYYLKGHGKYVLLKKESMYTHAAPVNGIYSYRCRDIFTDDSFILSGKLTVQIVDSCSLVYTVKVEEKARHLSTFEIGDTVELSSSLKIVTIVEHVFFQSRPGKKYVLCKNKLNPLGNIVFDGDLLASKTKQ